MGRRSLLRSPSTTHAHDHWDLQGLHLARLQDAADARCQDLATQGPQACHSLLAKTARAMLMPPGMVPAEVEGQELTVLEARGWDQVSARDTSSLQLLQPRVGALRRARDALPSCQPYPRCGP